MPAVSVVIPTHNRRRLLGQTLRSVLGQRGVDFEVVVVDDGSTDGTAEAVAALGDRRVRLLRHEHPSGVAAARNAGAAAAHGAWVALLDDDDLWAPDKLARQLAACGSEDSWVYAGAVEVDEAGRLLGGAPPLPPDALIAGLTTYNPMPAGSSNVMVQAALLADTGGFDPALRHMADWDLWLRLARQSRPACVAAPLVAYRIHPGQATMDTTGMVAEARMLQARHGADPATVHRWAAWSQLRAGRRWAAVAAYAAAVRTGDLASVARSAVALLSPRPTLVRPPLRRAAAAPDWHLAAQAWLEELAGVERAWR
jgi:glycosyltransferase involved in cell wall biosynthesis